MYKIEKTDYGFHLTFEGFVKHDEAQKWYDESMKVLQNSTASFGVLIDLRNMRPMPNDSQEVIIEGQVKFKENGMVRSAVILNNRVTTMQLKRLAKSSGIYDYERYIDSSEHANWEKHAINWIKSSIDPDK